VNSAIIQELLDTHPGKEAMQFFSAEFGIVANQVYAAIGFPPLLFANDWPVWSEMIHGVMEVVAAH
jgi:hypothetical protein